MTLLGVESGSSHHDMPDGATTLSRYAQCAASPWTTRRTNIAWFIP
jgi:hypothetical protein